MSLSLNITFGNLSDESVDLFKELDEESIDNYALQRLLKRPNKISHQDVAVKAIPPKANVPTDCHHQRKCNCNTSNGLHLLPHHHHHYNHFSSEKGAEINQKIAMFDC